MNGLYPYCVVPIGTAPPGDVLGLFGRAVHAHGIGPFEVWVSEAEAHPRMDLDEIRTHHTVVVAAMAHATPVPVRFGAWAPDVRVLEERVLARRAEIEAVQTQVEGRVEFGVRIGEPAGGSVPEVSDAIRDGRGYLRALAREQDARRRRRALQDEVMRELRSYLEGVPCDERVRRLDPPGLVAAAHLVRRDAEGGYRRCVDDFIREASGARRVHVTGPWPPYSFGS